MKKLLSVLLAAVLCFSVLIPASAVQDDLMIDSAGVLSAAEWESVSGILAEVSLRRGMNVAAATVNTLNGRDALDYANDYFDARYGANGVLLLLAMEERDWALVAVGDGYQAVNDDAQDYLIDRVLPLLKEDRYAEAFTCYGELCDQLILDWQNGEPYEAPVPWGICLLIALGVGLAAALITVCVMAGRLKSVRAQAGAAAYVKAGSRTLTVEQDTYLYSNVVRTPIPKNNSSGGGGGGGSRGGRSGGF